MSDEHLKQRSCREFEKTRVIGKALGSKGGKKRGRTKTKNLKMQALVILKDNPAFPKVLKLSKATFGATGFAPEDPGDIQGLELVTLLTRV